MFACHMTDEGKEMACAGWLAVSGENHIGVRSAAAQRRLPEEALRPQPGWPPLFADYDEMAERQGRRDLAPTDTEPSGENTPRTGRHDGPAS